MIVEGNSRYKEEGRSTRRKYNDRNNIFYEDHTAAQRNRDKSLEELDPEVYLESELLNRSRKRDKFRFRDRRSNNTRKGKIEAIWNVSNDLRNKSGNDGRGQSVDSTISDSLESRDFLGARRTTDLVIFSRNEIKPVLLEHSLNSSFTLNSNTSHSGPAVLGNKSRTGTADIAEVRSQITLDSPAVLDGDKPVSVTQEKVRNFVRIIPGYEASKNSDDKAAFLRSNIRNQVLRTGPSKTQASAKLPEPKSNKTVASFHRRVNQTNTQQFGSKNSKKKLIKVKPQVSQNREPGDKGNGNNGPKKNVKSKSNSTKTTLDLNLKNWPNGNLQNIEDLFNYEKYTSFNDGDESLEAQEVNSVGNSADYHKVTKKPSIIIFDQSLSPPQPVETDQGDVNLDQNPQQWAQIPPFTSENVGPLVSNVDQADSDPFDLIPEGIDFNRPLNSEIDQTQSNYHHGYVEDDVEIDQPVFENPNLEANFDPADVTRPTSEANGNVEAYGDYQYRPVPKPTYFNPTSVVSQNTVVHILNAGKKRPNVTVTEMKVPSLEGSPMNGSNSSSTAPNVHIMFTQQDSEDLEENVKQQIPEVSYDNGVNCPTITIDSYTRINNTIQGKEGCADLNIIINSHVLNTNHVIKPDTSSPTPGERYPGNVEGQPSYATPDGGYDTGGFSQSDLQDAPIADGPDLQSPGSSTFEVFQQTLINIGSQNDVPDVVQDVPITPEDEVEAQPVNGPGSPETLADPAAVTADDPVSGGANPSLPQAPLADEGPADALADTPEGVAADAPASPASGGSSGIQFPGGSNPLSGITSQLSDAVGNLGSQNQDGGSGGPGSVLGDADDDDYDDDIMDFIPFSMIESMTSVLPYVTLLNPLNYGMLSIAISPLAVATAGFLGLVAAFIPWALPRVLNFGRASDKVTIRFRQNLEDMVQQSIHRYKNWNEWKSKRKKRKR